MSDIIGVGIGVGILLAVFAFACLASWNDLGRRN